MNFYLCLHPCNRRPDHDTGHFPCPQSCLMPCSLRTCHSRRVSSLGVQPRMAGNAAQHEIVNLLKTSLDIFVWVWLHITMYLMCGPKQPFFFSMAQRRAKGLDAPAWGQNHSAGFYHHLFTLPVLREIRLNRVTQHVFWHLETYLRASWPAVYFLLIHVLWIHHNLCTCSIDELRDASSFCLLGLKSPFKTLYLSFSGQSPSFLSGVGPGIECLVTSHASAGPARHFFQGGYIKSYSLQQGSRRWASETHLYGSLLNCSHFGMVWYCIVVLIVFR